MGFRHEIRIRYGEVDMQGVVFNAHYLAYIDDAMTHFMNTLEHPYTDLGWDCMVVHAELDWRGSATFDDVLQIDGDVERWGTTSFDVRFTMHVGDRPVAAALLTYVGVKLGTTEKMAVPDEFKAALERGAAH